MKSYVMRLMAVADISYGRFDRADLSNQRIQVFSQPQAFNVNISIPTLSEWGLIAMAGILGIVGFMVIRRRKVNA